MENKVGSFIMTGVFMEDDQSSSIMILCFSLGNIQDIYRTKYSLA